MMKTFPPPHIQPSQRKVVMHHLRNVASREEVTTKSMEKWEVMEMLTQEKWK